MQLLVGNERLKESPSNKNSSDIELKNANFQEEAPLLDSIHYSHLTDIFSHGNVVLQEYGLQSQTK